MIRDIDKGRIMLVSDIHGNIHDFERIINTFIKLKKKKEIDYLIFMGDMIHAYPNKNRKDESVLIIDRLIAMNANMPGSDVLCMLGNHEFVHIYNIELLKGKLEFAKYFEWKIAEQRAKYIEFFMNMPLVIRTQGGTMIHHAGASDIYSMDIYSCFDLEFLKLFNHRNNKFTNHIDSINIYDAGIGEQFMNTFFGIYLWKSLSNGNEREFGSDYEAYINDFLNMMSKDRISNPMNILVTGHIGVDYGAETVYNNQLRLCTSEGCLRDLEKKYLLFNAEVKYNSASHLMEYCSDL